MLSIPLPSLSNTSCLFIFLNCLEQNQLIVRNQQMSKLVLSIIHYFLIFENLEIFYLLDSFNQKNVIEVKNFVLLTIVKYFFIYLYFEFLNYFFILKISFFKLYQFQKNLHLIHTLASIFQNSNLAFLIYANYYKILKFHPNDLACYLTSNSYSLNYNLKKIHFINHL